MKEISLQNLKISDLGPVNYLKRIMPNLKILSLEENLIFDYNQFFQIGAELSNLEILSLTKNFIRFPDNIHKVNKNITKPKYLIDKNNY